MSDGGLASEPAWNAHAMKRVLITGLSGVGKSSVIRRLDTLGYRAVDTDDGDFFELVASDDETKRRFGGETEWRWRRDRIGELLDEERGEILFVSGTSSNQSTFYRRFDRIILLTAPDDIMLERMSMRTNNPYGRDPAQRARQLELKSLLEPLLRKVADAVIDTNAPLDDVVAQVLDASA